MSNNRKEKAASAGENGKTAQEKNCINHNEDLELVKLLNELKPEFRELNSSKVFEGLLARIPGLKRDKFTAGLALMFSDEMNVLDMKSATITEVGDTYGISWKTIHHCLEHNLLPTLNRREYGSLLIPVCVFKNWEVGK